MMETAELSFGDDSCGDWQCDLSAKEMGSTEPRYKEQIDRSYAGVLLRTWW